MTTEIIEKELSFQIMEAAFEVQNQLGPGFFEGIYEVAMALELRSRGHQMDTQVRIPVLYKSQVIGEHILDQVVDHRVILELKAVSQIADIHKQQALSYLRATGLQLAIVINFGATRVQSARLVNTKIK